MHVSSEEDLVNIRVQAQCTIICIIFRVVQMVHVVREGPIGIAQLSMRDFLFNRELII